MKTIKLLMVSIMMLISSVLQATSYYVDATGGSDSNDGKTEATAWQTMSKVISNAKNLKPGDNVLFKRGERWDSRYKVSAHPSGTVDNPITYGVYGTGDKPIINVVVEQTGLEWEDLGDNQWQTNILYGTRFFKNGVEMIRAVREGDLGPNSLGTEYYYALGSPSILRIYLTTDPSSETFSWSSAIEAFSLDNASYIKLDGLDIRGSSGQGALKMENNDHWVVTNCNIGWNATYGITIRQSEDVLIENCILDANHLVDQSESPGGFNGADATGCDDGFLITSASHDIIIRGCYLKNWGHASLVAGSQKSYEERVYNLKFYNNELTTPDLIYGGRLSYFDYIYDSEFYNNYVHDIGVQCQIGGTHNHFHHNIIDGVLDSHLKDPSGSGLMIENYISQIKDNIIENNIIANSQGEGLFIPNYNSGSGSISDNVIRNNIFYNCGETRNNLSVRFYEMPDIDIFDNIIENNLVFSENTTNTCMYNSDTYSVELFNSQSDDVRDNIGGDPLFVDIASGDYHLQPGSPALDAGVTPLATKDYEGNTIPGDAADIGVYERQDDATPTTYMVTFQTDGTSGASLNNPEQQTVSSDNNYVCNPTVLAIAPEGYHFVNWTGTDDFITTSENPLTAITGKAVNKTITANFLDDNIVPDPILEAYYKLDGTAKDEIGAHNGNVSGGVAWSTSGYIDGAISLDGVDDLVDLGKIDITGTQISYCAWIKPSDVTGTHTAFGKAWERYRLGIWNGNYSFSVSVDDGNGSNVEIHYEDDAYPAVANKWVHLALTYDGTNVKCYLDGNVISTQANATPLAKVSYPCGIGYDPNVPERPFAGLIDEVRVYSSALTQEQIKGIMGNPTSIQNAGNSSTRLATIYPNPTTGLLVVDGENIQNVEIVDVMGRKCNLVTILEVNRRYNLSNLSEGIYFVKISNEMGDVITQKVILRK